MQDSSAIVRSMTASTLISRDLQTIARGLRQSSARRRRHAATTTAIGLGLIFVSHILDGEAPQRWIAGVSAVRADYALSTVIPRVPSSLVVPALLLPMWGSLLQVGIVVTVASMLVGWRTVLAVAIGVQYAATLAIHSFYRLGNRAWFGLTEAQMTVLDTGPSVAVMALAAFVSARLRTWTITLTLLGIIVFEIVSTPTLATIEHVIGVAAGTALGVAAGRRAQQISGPSRSVPRIHSISGGLLVLSGTTSLLAAAGLVPAAWSSTVETVSHPSWTAALVGGLVCLCLAFGMRRGARWAWLGVTVLLVTQVATSNDAELGPNVLLSAVGFGLVAAMCWFIAGSRPISYPTEPTPAVAVQLVRKNLATSLDWFALRNDKHWFVHRDTLVAYAVVQGTALVSPDPIGPAQQRADAWRAFRSWAGEHGLACAVVGASGGWLNIYHQDGMKSLYLGDEAVVRPGSLVLDGKRNKSLRQAVNRVRNHGYTASFYESGNIDPGLAEELRNLSTISRRGSQERGFSMTLGRVLNPTSDEELLIAVCRDEEGRPVAFCQFVPSARGWSLDAMRRDLGDHPNGIFDFLLTETILRATPHGHEVSLNFAVMHRLLIGEQRGIRSIASRALRKVARSTQIESFNKFNERFNPDWEPRHIVYEHAAEILPTALAYARAEGLSEIPIFGRHFKPLPAVRSATSVGE
jgi:lysylphosphatidylglycerol synthetase-like protein (DUF2156 family)